MRKLQSKKMKTKSTPPTSGSSLPSHNMVQRRSGRIITRRNKTSNGGSSASTTTTPRSTITTTMLKVLLTFVFMALSGTFWMGIVLHQQQQPQDSSTSIIVLSSNNNDYNHQQQSNLVETNNLNRNWWKNPNSTTTDIEYLQYLQHNNLWENHPRLPKWMNDYMTWHTRQLQNLTIENWESHRYLILACYKKYERCAGASDRLKPVPLIMLSAYKSNRLMFIHWNRPYPLEEFLISPIGGYPWHVPTFLEDIFLHHPTQIMTRAKNIVHWANTSQSILVHSHIHDSMGGAEHYNIEFNTNNTTTTNTIVDYFGQIYHDLFRILFEPSPPISQLIKSKLESKKGLLIPGEYAVAHYRADYGREVQRHPVLTSYGFMKKISENAIRCASELMPNAPIYFASDNPLVMSIVQNYSITHNNYPIIMFERSESKVLPLDYYNDTIGSINFTYPKDYYSTFVDLLIAGNGRCVSFGRGGFGRFANLLSYNQSCSKKHVKAFFSEFCNGYGIFYIKDQSEVK